MYKIMYDKSFFYSILKDIHKFYTNCMPSRCLKYKGITFNIKETHNVLERRQIIIMPEPNSPHLPLRQV